MSRGLSQDPPTPNQANLYQCHKPLTHQVPRQACHENVSANKPVLTHPPVPSYSLDPIKKVCHSGRGSYASFGSIHRSVQWAEDLPSGRRCEGWVLTASGSEHHDNDESNEEHGQNRACSALHGPRYMTKVQSPDAPEKPLAYEGPSATYHCLPVDKYISLETKPSPHKQEKMKIPPIRVIDFTNLPPSTRHWHFPEADGTKSGDKGTILLVVEPTKHDKVKTPKKISLANHARVHVYMVSPRCQ